MPSPVRVAATSHPDPARAIAALLADLGPGELAGIVLFCSSRYAQEPLAAALAAQAGGITVIGCTTSGEITPDGLAEGTLTAIGFPAEDFRLTAACFDALDRFQPTVAHRQLRTMVAEADELARYSWGRAHHAGIFLVDGLSHREEMLTLAVQDALGNVPLVGGSSGDGLEFAETFVLAGGRFRRDAAVVGLLSSSRPLKVFRAQHCRPGAARMVITGADIDARIVHEINAEPAAAEYARMIGARVEELGPALFASHPPMVRAGGEYYVRSIRSANPDGSLTFYCAIDEGVVLTLGETDDIMASLDGLFRELDADVGGIDRVLGFDCVLNGLEIRQRQLTDQVSRLYASRGVIGFNTYGEQFKALHVNQTFSGLAIGVA